MNVIKRVVGERNLFCDVADTELYVGWLDGFGKDSRCINAVKFGIGVCFSHLQGPGGRPTAWIQDGDALLQQLGYGSVIITTQTDTQEHKVRVDLSCTLAGSTSLNTVVMHIEESSVADALYLPLLHVSGHAHTWLRSIHLPSSSLGNTYDTFSSAWYLLPSLSWNCCSLVEDVIVEDGVCTSDKTWTPPDLFFFFLNVTSFVLVFEKKVCSTIKNTIFFFLKISREKERERERYLIL